MSTEPNSVLILGYGYTGPYLEEELRSRYPGLTIHKSTRDGRHSSFVFDQDDPRTWDQIPQVDLTFCLFPLKTNELASFKKHIQQKSARIVITSSTGFFLTQNEDQRVTETTAIDLGRDRTQAEEDFRQSGAIVVHAAGIYGLNRNPFDWLRDGRVGNSSKFINLIHVQDLSQILRRAGESSPDGARWIACDQKSYRWSELVDIWSERYGLPSLPQKQPQRSSKLVDASYTRQQLQINLLYPSVIEGVTNLMSQTPKSESSHNALKH